MFGKASLLLVLGFSLIFLVFGQRFGIIQNQAVDNMVDYYDESVAHEAASAGANLAASKIFHQPGWTEGFNNLNLNGGNFDVTVEPEGDLFRVVSIGRYKLITHRTEILLRPSSFSRFAYYSVMERASSGSDIIWWTGNDTVWGPFHTEDYLFADNHPVFLGKATTAQSIIYHDYWDAYKTEMPQKPVGTTHKNKYNQSVTADQPIVTEFGAGESLPLPMDGLQPIRDAAVSGGKLFSYNSSSKVTYESLSLTFNNNQIAYTIHGQKKSGKSWYSFDSTYTEEASILAPNGVLFLDGTDQDGDPIDLRLKGTVQGQFSVAGTNNIYLDDDVKYSINPRTDPNCSDLLGIIAQENVWIADNNNTTNIRIDAAIYCHEGGFGAEEYNTRSIDGDINLCGGITQNIRRAVGTYNSATGNPAHGFNKKYHYDGRLLLMSPPNFPHTDTFEVVSWLDE